MLKRFQVPILLVPVLLAGCGGPLHGGYNGGLESIHQPVVSRNDYAFDVATQGYGLAPGEADRLAGWMASLRLGYGDRIAVDDGGARNAAVREAVSAEASHYGLLLSDEAPVTAGAIAPGTVRIVVSRSTAAVPNCPDYSAAQPDYRGGTTSNFGCAINSNLAAMVANPNDLVRGQTGDPTIDNQTSTKAVNALRRAAPTGGGGTQVKQESTKSGGSQ